jgi:hypothetical protein
MNKKKIELAPFPPLEYTYSGFGYFPDGKERRRQKRLKQLAEDIQALLDTRRLIIPRVNIKK